MCGTRCLRHKSSGRQRRSESKASLDSETPASASPRPRLSAAAKLLVDGTEDSGYRTVVNRRLEGLPTKLKLAAAVAAAATLPVAIAVVARRRRRARAAAAALLV